MSAKRNGSVCTAPGVTTVELRRRPRISRAVIMASFWAIALAPVAAQNLPSDRPVPPDALEPPAWPRSTRIVPAPDPFSLNGYDARQAMAMIRRAGLLIRSYGGVSREIVVVETVEAVRGEVIEDYPPLHRQRWNLHLNGAPISWNDTYIEYGGRLVNLQLLFTYRNQRPVRVPQRHGADARNANISPVPAVPFVHE